MVTNIILPQVVLLRQFCLILATNFNCDALVLSATILSLSRAKFVLKWDITYLPNFIINNRITINICID